MFKVGDKRKPSRTVPGRLYFSFLKAERLKPLDEIDEETKQKESKFDWCYAILKYKGHSVRPSACVVKDEEDEKNKQVAYFNDESKQLESFREANLDSAFDSFIDIPHTGYNSDSIKIEVYETARKKVDVLDFELRDKDNLLGEAFLPLSWLVNGFGCGWAIPLKRDRAAVTSRFKLKGNSKDPWELEVRMLYDIEDEKSQRSLKRWTSWNFDGSYRLDRSKSDSAQPLLAHSKVPFPLRKLDDFDGEEKLVIRVSDGGSSISFTNMNQFYKQSTGAMKIDELFQSVPTYRGTVVEKRLYWDYTSMKPVEKGDPYPSGILMAATRTDGDSGDIVEAWHMSSDRKELEQLMKVEGEDEKFKKVWERLPEDEESFERPPKVVTRRGKLIAAVIRGEKLSPESRDEQVVTAYAALKIQRFANEDRRYQAALGRADDEEEVQTRYYVDEPNPVWNQVFQFDVQSKPGSHSCLIIQVWNRASEEEDSLIGTVRVPIPWIYNGFGSELGPDGLAFFETTLKLRRGENLDPTSKDAKMGGGRIVVRFAYQSAEKKKAADIVERRNAGPGQPEVDSSAEELTESEEELADDVEEDAEEEESSEYDTSDDSDGVEQYSGDSESD